MSVSRVRLDATSNQPFRLTLNCVDLIALYDLSTATLRMRAQNRGGSYFWATSGAPGLIAVDAASGLAVLTAPLADMGAMAGIFAFDLRLELPGGGKKVIGAGSLHFVPGTTVAAADSGDNAVGGVGDTVAVDGVLGGAPYRVEMDLSDAAAASTRYADEAVDAMAALFPGACEDAVDSLTPPRLLNAPAGVEPRARPMSAADWVAICAAQAARMRIATNVLLSPHLTLDYSAPGFAIVGIP
jgi:hypothetical protein